VTGDFHVPGAGLVKYWNREADSASGQPGTSPGGSQPSRTVTRTSNPRGPMPVANGTGGRRVGEESKKKAASTAPERGPLKLKLTVIKFDQSMQGNFLPGKEGEGKARTADFFGNVDALHAPVANTKVDFDFDKPPRDFSHITAQTMRLISEPPPADAPPNTPSRTYVQAFDNAFVRRADATIQADKVTYDSEKDLSWAYGYEGRPVTINQYKGIGQRPSQTQGSALRYIHRTGEAELIDPQTIQLVDLQHAVRPTPDKPGGPKPPVRPPRGRLPNRSNVERRTFNGR
jgi:hypothetical protein